MPTIYYDSKGMPIYDPKDGWKDYSTFQAAALNEMDSMKQDQSKHEIQQMQADPYAKKAIALLPAVGGALGAAIPGAGETGLSEVGGAALGSAAKAYLRSRYPATFGYNPSTLTGQVADTGTDILTGAAPGIAEGIGNLAATAGSALPIVGRAIGAASNAIKNIPLAAQIAAKLGIRGAGIMAKQPSSSSPPGTH